MRWEGPASGPGACVQPACAANWPPSGPPAAPKRPFAAPLIAVLLPNGQWGVVKEFHNLHGHIAYEAELAAYRVCQEKGVSLAPLAGKVKDGPYRALLYVLQDSGDLLQSMQE